MEALLSFNLVVNALILLGVGFLAFEISAIRKKLLPDILHVLRSTSQYGGVYRSWRVDHHHDDIPHDVRAHRIGSFVIWEWRDGDWQPRDVPEGVKPDFPPAFPGAFKGDIAKTWVAMNR
jgi:hypothetical protein